MNLCENAAMASEIRSVFSFRNAAVQIMMRTDCFPCSR